MFFSDGTIENRYVGNPFLIILIDIIDVSSLVFIIQLNKRFSCKT